MAAEMLTNQLSVNPRSAPTHKQLYVIIFVSDIIE